LAIKTFHLERKSPRKPKKYTKGTPNASGPGKTESGKVTDSQGRTLFGGHQPIYEEKKKEEETGERQVVEHIQIRNQRISGCHLTVPTITGGRMEKEKNIKKIHNKGRSPAAEISGGRLRESAEECPPPLKKERVSGTTTD